MPWATLIGLSRSIARLRLDLAFAFGVLYQRTYHDMTLKSTRSSCRHTFDHHSQWKDDVDALILNIFVSLFLPKQPSTYGKLLTW